MSIDTIQATPESVDKATTKRREWWGWFGSAVWMFFMMYGFDVFALPEGVFDGGSVYAFIFMLLFALSITVFGWRYGNDPNGLAKIAFYTTPVAIAITAVFIFLPQPLGYLLYTISPVLMAPAFTRRIYGVIRTAEPDRRLTRYMAGITVCVTAFTFWLIFDPPKEIAFFIPALLATPAWMGIRRVIALTNKFPTATAGKFKITKKLIIPLLGAVVVLFWFNSMNAMIHTHIVNVGLANDDMFYTLSGFILPPIAFLLYGFINDKGHERVGFMCGMGLCIIGALLAMLPDSLHGSVLLPLTITDGLGGSYTEFFILTIPIIFLFGEKRPVFISSLGLTVNIFYAALFWINDLWIPTLFRELGAPLFISAAISAVVFIVLVWVLFERHREKTLAAALYALLRGNESVTGAPEADAPPPAEPTGAAMTDAGFTEQEKAIALLLMEGDARRDISRKLHMTAAELNQHITAIKRKVSGAEEHDPVVAAVVKKFKLTGRETEILRCLSRNMTNPDIAAELFLSEDTIKWHVRNLLKKLSLDNRSGVRTWLSAFGEEVK